MGGGGAAAEREEGKDSGRRLDPVNTDGSAGRAGEAEHARTKPTSERPVKQAVSGV